MQPHKHADQPDVAAVLGRPFRQQDEHGAADANHRAEAELIAGVARLCKRLSEIESMMHVMQTGVGNVPHE
jgi:hypothetical protein